MKVLKHNLIKTNLIIVKLIIPLYVLVDVLNYFGLLSSISILFQPVASLLGLPPEAALALAGGGVFNLYTGIAFAAPLELSISQWTTLGIFLGLFHSILIEASILKRLKIPYWFSISSRLLFAFIFSFVSTFLYKSTGVITNKTINSVPNFDTLFELLNYSLTKSTVLCLKVMMIVSFLTILIHYVKKSHLVKDSSTIVTLTAGVFLGVTYGAGLLLNSDQKRKSLPLFLTYCHGIVEETALFTMFGAAWLPIVGARLLSSFLVLGLYQVLTTLKQTKESCHA